MKKVNSIALLLILLFLINACAKKQYGIKNATGYLVEMNSSIDDRRDQKMYSIVQSFKNRLDKEMHEVIGEATINLTKSGTQSVLANFTADAMQEYASGLWGKVDFAVINNGGLRTTLNKGPVTIGNIYEIYVFENYLILLELPGKAVKKLFETLVINKIGGFSKGASLILKNDAIESLIIGGKPFDENATYRIATVDYLAEGNDGMDALTQASQNIDSNVILRDAMIEYIKKLTSENIKIYAVPDSRIEIKE